jgi:NAD(P)-dependent dehydrogenase (short-subunit alcohol dehydrogenase family)
MKIVIVGSTGTIGKAIVEALSGSHDIVQVGNRGGDFQVDISSTESIKKLYDILGKFDALVSAAGMAKFGALAELKAEDFSLGLNHKLMGQVNLVRLGLDHINDNGSFTLTSGGQCRYQYGKRRSQWFHARRRPGNAACNPHQRGQPHLG